MNINNIIFDLDGTLTNPSEGIVACIKYSLKELGFEIPPTEALLDCIGPPLRRCFAEILGSNDPKLVEIAVLKYRERFEQVGLYENYVYEGIPEILEKLTNSGRNLYVATSKPKIFAQKIIEHFQLSRYFRDVFGPGLDGTFSEKTELLGYVIENKDLNPLSCLMVGDRKFDIVAAKENNICAIGVAYGFGSIEELKGSGAYHICFSPLEILDVVSIFETVHDS